MIIGICGYGYTGSGALFDLLREYDDIGFPNNRRTFEFALPYNPYGLQDLKYHLVQAPVKHTQCDAAIYDFIRMTNWFRRSYDRETHGQFSILTKEYLNKIIGVSYKSRIWYHHDSSKASILFYLGSSYLKSKIDKVFKGNNISISHDTRYIANTFTEERFDEITKEYLDGLIRALNTTDRKRFLLDQVFSPNFPEQIFTWFDDPKAIVVDRDPRDVYLLVKHLATVSNGDFIPHDTVENFVKAYRAVRVHASKEDPNRVLRINFEDLIYEYDRTVSTIEQFLGIREHTRKFERLNPQVSIRNTQMMDVFPDDAKDIKYIEAELPEFLFDFSKYPKVENRGGVLAFVRLTDDYT